MTSSFFFLLFGSNELKQPSHFQTMHRTELTKFFNFK